MAMAAVDNGINQHILLGGQVVLGAIVFAGGLYGFLNAFNKSGTIPADTGALYVFLGIVSAIVGAAICISALP